MGNLPPKEVISKKTKKSVAAATEKGAAAKPEILALTFEQEVIGRFGSFENISFVMSFAGCDKFAALSIEDGVVKMNAAIKEGKTTGIPVDPRVSQVLAMLPSANKWEEMVCWCMVGFQQAAQIEHELRLGATRPAPATSLRSDAPLDLMEYILFDGNVQDRPRAEVESRYRNNVAKFSGILGENANRAFVSERRDAEKATANASRVTADISFIVGMMVASGRPVLAGDRESEYEELQEAIARWGILFDEVFDPSTLEQGEYHRLLRAYTGHRLDGDSLLAETLLHGLARMNEIYAD